MLCPAAARRQRECALEVLAVTLGTTVLVEGVTFLYAQAGEVLSAWREQRKDPQAPPPKILPPPAQVTVGPQQPPQPVADPTDRSMEDAIAELREIIEPVQAGNADPTSEAARKAAGTLRAYLEQILGASITLTGEQPRTLTIRDINVVARDTQGSVRGLRADLDKLRGDTTIERVSVDATGTKQDVTGVDLT